MTRAALEKNMNEFGFRKTFESSAETVWNRGKNQLELFSDGRILLMRTTCLVLDFPLRTLKDISEIENCVPDTITFSLANGIHADIEYRH